MLKRKKREILHTCVLISCVPAGDVGRGEHPDGLPQVHWGEVQQEVRRPAHTHHKTKVPFISFYLQQGRSGGLRVHIKRGKVGGGGQVGNIGSFLVRYI